MNGPPLFLPDLTYMCFSVSAKVFPINLLVLIREVMFMLATDAALIIILIYSHIVKNVVVVIKRSRMGLAMVLHILPACLSMSV